MSSHNSLLSDDPHVGNYPNTSTTRQRVRRRPALWRCVLVPHMRCMPVYRHLPLVLGLATIGMATCVVDGSALADDTATRQLSGRGDEVVWNLNMQAAMLQAEAEGKDLLISFTGSDWCTWCRKLTDEVFTRPEFVDWVESRFVPVRLDYPNDREHLSKAAQQQNEQLLNQFAVQGFPCVFLADAQGRPYARTGYREGGAVTYVAHLQELQTVREMRDEAFRFASEAQGSAKFRYLDDALSTMDADIVRRHYGDEIEQVLAGSNQKLIEKYGRLKESINRMEQAGISREEWMSDPFGFLAADMFEAAEDLKIAETKPPVAEYHPRIENRLAKLIELMAKT